MGECLKRVRFESTVTIHDNCTYLTTLVDDHSLRKSLFNKKRWQHKVMNRLLHQERKRKRERDRQRKRVGFTQPPFFHYSFYVNSYFVSFISSRTSRRSTSHQLYANALSPASTLAKWGKQASVSSTSTSEQGAHPARPVGGSHYRGVTSCGAQSSPAGSHH